MKTSDKMVEFIKRHEGYRADAYYCEAGVPTIGYGHTNNVKIGDHVTPEKAEEFLRQDLQRAEKEINKIANLTQCQFDALVSFVYNVGVGNFRRSTLYVKVCNNPFDPSIPDEFRKWAYVAGGKFSAGLQSRRNAEANFYRGIA